MRGGGVRAVRSGAGRPSPGATPRPAHLLRPNPPAGPTAPRPPSFVATPPAAVRAARGGAGLTAALCPQPNDGSGTQTPAEQPSPHRAPPRGSAPQPRGERPRLRGARNRTGHRAAGVPVPPPPAHPAHRGLLQRRRRPRVPRSGSAPRHRRQPEPRAPGAAPTPAPLPGTHRPEEVRPEAETAGRTGGGPAAPLRPRRAERGPETAAAPPGTCPPRPEPPGAASPGVGALPPACGGSRAGGGGGNGRRDERGSGSGQTAQILGALRPPRSALRPIPRRRAAATGSRGRAPVRGWAARSARSRRRPPRSERRPPAPLPYTRRRRRR